jgi:transcriptional regulator with XRE-family HTH domain
MSNKFSQNVKKILRERKLSNKEVCASAQISPSTLSQWLKGQKPLMDDSVLRLARCLGVTVDFLLSGEQIPADLQQNIDDILSQDFFELHSGLYKLTVHKYAGKSLKRGN